MKAGRTWAVLAAGLAVVGFLAYQATIAGGSGSKVGENNDIGLTQGVANGIAPVLAGEGESDGCAKKAEMCEKKKGKCDKKAEGCEKKPEACVKKTELGETAAAEVNSDAPRCEYKVAKAKKASGCCPHGEPEATKVAAAESPTTQPH